MSDDTVKSNGHTSLTNSDLLKIHAALVGLEQPVPLVVEGKETRQPYAITDGAKLAIIRNIKNLKVHTEEINELREDMRRVYNPNQKKTQDLEPAKASEWDDKHNKLMKELRSVKLHSFKLDDLQIVKNTTMPPTLIAELLGTVVTDTGTQDG